MENSKSKPDYFKVAYSIRTPSYYRPETTDSVFERSGKYGVSCGFRTDILKWRLEN